MEVISEILKKHEITPTSECLSYLFLIIYEMFVEELDAVDNGIPMYVEGTPCYRINTHLSARVNKLNPVWNSPKTENIDELFKKAMILVGSEFTQQVIEVSDLLCKIFLKFHNYVYLSHLSLQQFGGQLEK